jgi:hypothetical protein
MNGSQREIEIGRIIGEPQDDLSGDWLRLRVDAIIDSHRSNRIVPGWQSRMSFDAETADLLCVG